MLPSEPAFVGPFRVTGVLGRGAMGVVYRGEHPESGARVAVKTVATPVGALVAAIRREIDALGLIRHPGVVRIVDQGVSDGLPWYAMDLLVGRTLRDLYRSRRERGEPALGTILTLLRRLCVPLAFAHGHGVVHRDLKPDNVFIRSDDTPVLVDFGIAARGALRGRESLDVGGFVVGSPSYMAPEQIRGEFVDARADLYALGCLLYEGICGRPPFADGPLGEIYDQHLNATPVPPSERAAGVPPELDRLVMRLLAKRPPDRLGYADDVAAALAELGAAGWPDGGLAPARPYLYRAGFAGRADVLASLSEALDEAKAGAGRCVLVAGESGAGKTRLAMEVASLAVQRRFQVITGECGPVPAPLAPLRPLLLAVADRCRQEGAAATARLLGDRGPLLAAYEASLTRVPGSSEAAPIELPPAAARAHLLASLRETLFAFAAESPLLLVLDDLQWSDELSLGFLQSLPGDELRRRPLLLVGTYRLDEASDGLRALAAAPGVVHRPIGRMDRDSVGAMVGGMLGLHEPPPDLVAFLGQQSGGNPFFIAEYLRAAIAEGVLSRDQVGRWRFDRRHAHPIEQSLPLPQSLVRLVETRLGRLNDAGRSLVELAAVFGRELDGELLLAASALDEPAKREAIAELRARQVLEEGEAGRFRFIHDKLHEIAYQRIAMERRPSLHEAAARAIEARLDDGPDAARAWPQLARHWSEARVHDRASHFHRLAGDRSRAAYANAEAIGHYRAAVAHAEEARASPDPLPELLESLGDVLALTGRHDEADAAYLRALGRLPDGAARRRAALHRKRGKLAELHHRHREALSAYSDAEAALGERPTGDDWWPEWTEIQLGRLAVHYWLAQVERARALVGQVRPVVERHGTPQQRARFFQTLVQLNLRRERYDASTETVGYAEKCLSASEELGDAAEIATARFGLALVLVFHGALDEAEERMRRALDGAERTGDVALQARCLTYLALIARRRRDVEGTALWAARSLAVASDAKLVDYIGAARAHLAWTALRRGDHEGVVEHGRAALELWRSLPYDYPLQWTARLPLLAVGGEAHEHARALLDDKQQRLPDPLSSSLARCADGAPPHAVLDAAAQFGYL